MAQYTVTYSCGHEGTERLIGKMTERRRHIEACANKLCPDCYRKQREAEGPEWFARIVPGQGLELYALNSYAIKDALKARGYHFGEFSRPDQAVAALGLAGMGGYARNAVGQIYATPKGWGKVLTEAQALVDEIEWIKSQGWTIHQVDQVLSLVQAV